MTTFTQGQRVRIWPSRDTVRSDVNRGTTPPPHYHSNSDSGESRYIRDGDLGTVHQTIIVDRAGDLVQVLLEKDAEWWEREVDRDRYVMIHACALELLPEVRLTFASTNRGESERLE
jgi:hypothetical protein